MPKDKTKMNVVFTAKPPASVGWGSVVTPFGPMLLGMTEEGALCRLEFMKKQEPEAIINMWQRVWPKTVFVKDAIKTAKLARQIFSGGKSSAPKAVKIVLAGTPFQRLVWKALLAVNKGQTASYADIARRIKRPKASRAVGNALGANPVPVLVPCHRVIATDGSLGGYGGGVAIKKNLLKAENAIISKY